MSLESKQTHIGDFAPQMGTDPEAAPRVSVQVARNELFDGW